MRIFIFFVLLCKFFLLMEYYIFFSKKYLCYLIKRIDLWFEILIRLIVTYNKFITVNSV